MITFPSSSLELRGEEDDISLPIHLGAQVHARLLSLYSPRPDIIDPTTQIHDSQFVYWVASYLRTWKVTAIPPCLTDCVVGPNLNTVTVQFKGPQRALRTKNYKLWNSGFLPAFIILVCYFLYYCSCVFFLCNLLVVIRSGHSTTSSLLSVSFIDMHHWLLSSLEFSDH